jgi:hypothetical protein
VGVDVHGTGVLIRLTTDREEEALAEARRTGKLCFEPSRSFECRMPPPRPGADETLVVLQAFVEFSDERGRHRWGITEHHGHVVSVRHDATIELLRLASEVSEDVIDLLAEMRIADLPVTRWQLMSAPRRMELEPRLRDRLAPLQRG